jgi:hypothetical protein
MTIKLFFRRRWDNDQAFIESYRYTFKIFLIFDILLNINTGIYRSGTVVSSRGEIFKHYLKKGFLQDLLSLFSIFIPFVGSENSKDIPALMESSQNLVKLLFLFKLSQVKRVFDVIEETLFYDETYEAVISLFGLFAEVLFIAHWICCLWNISAWIETSNGNSSWHQKSFYDDIGITEVPWSKEYLFSFYWSLTTMITVGYGDISPKGDLEVITASLSMLFGCGFFAYAINRIGFILEKFSLKHKNLRLVLCLKIVKIKEVAIFLFVNIFFP